MFEKIIKLLNDAESVSIYSHINTDCDAMGSSLALKLALEQFGKRVDVYSNSDFPSNFKFYGEYMNTLNKKTCDKYDLAVCLDTPNENRLGKYKFSYRKGVKNVIVIDHHTLSNEKFSRFSYVLEASSTCEILYGVLRKLNIKFETNICRFLLSGILTDTGKFSHSVTPKTVRIVSKLMAFGKVDMESITTPLFNSMSFNTFGMLKKLYNNIEFYCDNKFALVMFKRQDFIDSQTTLDDTNAFPDLPLQLESVQFCILASEDDKGYFRVSFRSKGDISARSVAESFGGGGHPNASGCKIFGSFEEVKQRLIDSTIQVLGWKNND